MTSAKKKPDLRVVETPKPEPKTIAPAQSVEDLFRLQALAKRPQ